MDKSDPPAQSFDNGLSLDQREQIVARLKERGGPQNCEVCNTNKWVIGALMTSPTAVGRTETGGIKLDPAGRLYVSAPLLCKNCGNTKLLNLKMLGLTEIYHGSGG